MADFNPSRLGQINVAGDPQALFLKVFSGEVLTAFAETNVFLSRNTVRSISSGKSAQFPATWKGTAEYHVPGTEILGDQVPANEKIISIDSLLIAPRFIANIDEAMNHYDVRSIYSRDMGMALSRTYDQQVAQLFCLAARASATFTSGFNGGSSGGTQIVDANAGTTADNLVADIFTAARRLDEKYVPESDRFVAVKPQYYYLLVNASKVTNRDYTRDLMSQNGGIDVGKVLYIAGVEVVKSNNVPASNVTTGPSAYQGNFSNTVAVVGHPTAVGTVKLIDLAMEMEYQIRYQGTLMVGKYAMGHGILRPESAVEIVTA